MRAWLVLMLAGCGDQANPTRAVVTAFGAHGDGVADDTAAIQAAVDSVGPGGTILVPGGVYLVQPVGPMGGVQLHSGQTLELSADATLQAIGNDSPEYGLVRIYEQTDVTVRGGTLVGERDQHTGTGGEKGHGIGVRSSQRVVIDGVTLHDFWGDGIYIGPVIPDGPASEDVRVSDCVSYNNRRQGLSVTHAARVVIERSSFYDIHGTQPQAGVDLEPSYPNHYVVDVQLVDSMMRTSQFGLQVVQQTGMTANITVRRNVIANNSSGGIWVVGTPAPVELADNVVTGNGVGIWLQGARDNLVTNNHVANNLQRGIWLEGASENTVSGNTLAANGGADGSYDNIEISGDSDANLIGGNSVRGPARYGVVVGTTDCTSNAIDHNDLANAGDAGAILDLGTATAIGSNTY